MRFFGFVFHEEETLYPTVINVGDVFADINGRDGGGIERGDFRFVLSVYKHSARARFSVADTACLDEEGDQHVLIGIQREFGIFHFRRVSRSVCGEQHDDVVVVCKGELIEVFPFAEVVFQNVVAVRQRLQSCVIVKSRNTALVLGGHAVGTVVGDDVRRIIFFGARSFFCGVDGDVVKLQHVEFRMQVKRVVVFVQFGRVKDFGFFGRVQFARFAERDVFEIVCIGNDFAGQIVEQSVAVDLLETVGVVAHSQSEHDTEGTRCKRVCADIERVFRPAVVFGNVFGIDVFDLHLVERTAAHRVRYSDICARVFGDFNFVVGVIVRQVRRLYPNGNFRRSARRKGDACTGRITLRRSRNIVLRRFVVDHKQIGGSLFFRFGVTR